jgi:hypothetical protein
MSADEKVVILTDALAAIREATYAEFQVETDPRYGFRPKRDACPLCRRASTAQHLRQKWAGIQSEAARALRDTE